MFTLATDLRAALTTLANYQWVWQTHTTFSIARGRNVSTFSYLITDHEVWPRRHDAECTLASFCALIRQLTHSRWAPEHVQFEHSVAGRIAKLRKYFRCAVTGGSSANILTIRNEDLDERMRRAPGAPDISILPILERHLTDLVTKEPLKIQSAADLVNAYIARRLGRETTSVVDAAAHIGLSARTLRRRLAEEGLTYRKLLQAQRQLRSESALREGDTPLTVVAQQLGYSDYTTLSRAFKSWTGMSPQRFSLTKSR
jgi:AraC-like DNA-binding protein